MQRKLKPMHLQIIMLPNDAEISFMLVLQQIKIFVVCNLHCSELVLSQGPISIPVPTAELRN